VARPVPPELTKFLAPFSEDIQGIALALRKRVLAVMPDGTNSSGMRPTPSRSYTPSTRWQDGVVHIATYAKRVNLSVQ
jgi:hypothetical protein